MQKKEKGARIPQTEKIPYSSKSNTYCRMGLKVYFYETFTDKNDGKEKHWQTPLLFAQWKEDMADRELLNYFKSLAWEYVNGKYARDKTFMCAIVYRGYPTLLDQRRKEIYRLKAQEVIAELIMDLINVENNYFANIIERIAGIGVCYSNTSKLIFSDVHEAKKLFKLLKVNYNEQGLDNALWQNVAQKTETIESLRKLYLKAKDVQLLAKRRLERILQNYKRSFQLTVEQYNYLLRRFEYHSLSFPEGLFGKALYNMPEEPATAPAINE